MTHAGGKQIAARVATPRDRTGLLLALFLLISTPLFALFSYNSGYGYDQLEYLVIGRSMTDGLPLYTYYPSKSPGIYYLVAWLHALGVSFRHASLSVVIALLYALMVGATWQVVRRTAGGPIALVSAILVALCIAFMELNFLQPTGFVLLAGLLAAHFMLRAVATDRRRLFFLAGGAVALGVLFKASAAPYGLALALFAAVSGMRQRRVSTVCLAWLPALALGFAVVFGAAAVYYAATGRFHAFWHWTIIYPAFIYPAYTTYLNKLYTKLLFFHLLFPGAMLLSLHPRFRRAVYASDLASLSLLMGLLGYLPVLKIQSSHYCFPGAAFLSIFSAIVLVATARAFDLTRRRLLPLAAGAGLMLLLLLSACLYRPQVFTRLFTIRSFAAHEEPLTSFVQQLVPPHKQLLMFGPGDMELYWISHRYPPPPYIVSSEQMVWSLWHEPGAVFDLLKAPDLEAVVFDPDKVELNDTSMRFGRQPGDRALWDQLYAHIEERFERLPRRPEGYTFWKRRAAVAGR